MAGAPDCARSTGKSGHFGMACEAIGSASIARGKIACRQARQLNLIMVICRSFNYVGYSTCGYTRIPCSSLRDLFHESFLWARTGPATTRVVEMFARAPEIVWLTVGPRVRASRDASRSRKASAGIHGAQSLRRNSLAVTHATRAPMCQAGASVEKMHRIRMRRSRFI